MPAFGEPFFCAPWVGYRRSTDAPPSDGWIKLFFHGSPSVATQALTAAELPTRAAALNDAILNAVVEAYPHLRAEPPLPESATRASLRNAVQLYQVTLLDDAYEGQAYAAYCLACDWTNLVVVTHEDRIVAVGGSEVLSYPVADSVRGAVPPSSLAGDAERAAMKESAVAAALRNPVGFESVDDELVVVIPCWAGFCIGPARGSDTGVSSGEVLVSISGADAVDADAPVQAQRAAYRHALEHAEALQAVVLEAIGNAHPNVTPLRDHVALASVLVHLVEKDGVAYVGYLLHCDDEHGVGVMTHGERIVAVGGADTAVLSWIAERDRDPGKPKRAKKLAPTKKPKASPAKAAKVPAATKKASAKPRAQAAARSKAARNSGGKKRTRK